MRTSGASFEIEELGEVSGLSVATGPYFVRVVEHRVSGMIGARIWSIAGGIELPLDTAFVVTGDFGDGHEEEGGTGVREDSRKGSRSQGPAVHSNHTSLTTGGALLHHTPIDGRKWNSRVTIL